MRIAFASNPALGHLLPLVPLAQAARDAGHDVVVVGGASLAGATRDAGLPHVAAGPPDLPSVLAGIPERDGLTGARLATVTWRRAFAGILAGAMASAVVELAASWRPDLVVHEDSEQGSWIAAERLGVPSIGLEATAWLGNRYRLSDVPLNRLRREHGLPEDPGLGRWHRFGFLTTRPPGLGDAADPLPAGTRPIRPAPPAAGGEAPWWPVAGPGRARVLVTMGTLVTGRHEIMEAILDGLEPLGVSIVAAVGHDLDPASLGSRPSSTRVVRYVPIGPLLETASLLVFHAGSGTMLAGLAAGVPLVVLPVNADQPVNAERCVAAGVARALAPDARGAEDVGRAARAVLDDGRYSIAARRLQAEIAAMPAPEDVLPWLERLAREGGPAAGRRG
jgi:UDP:flavonoid glycosyltransferase YjiC (YdhE family)